MKNKDNIEKIMEVRDIRNKEWFWIDNDFIDKYARILGSSCAMVYLSLCRHSDNETQQCFPGIRLMSEELLLGTKTIERATKKLKDQGMITITKRKSKKGTRMNNVYTLVSKNTWKNIGNPSDISHQTFDHQTPQQLDPSDISHQTPQPHNNTQYNHTNSFNIDTVINNEKEDSNNIYEKKINEKIDIFSIPSTTPLEREIGQVAKMFSLLDSANWESFYQPGPERTSIKKLLEFTKRENINLQELINMAKDAHGIQYEPQIFTPTEMITKYSKLIASRNKTVRSQLDPGVPYKKGKYSNDKSIIG